MTASPLPVDLRRIERKLRLLAILDAGVEVGLVPMGVLALHAVAYFADVLAPVWGLPIIEGQMLKRQAVYYPSLQQDLDELVGQGVVLVEGVSHVQVADGAWRPEGNYTLNRVFTDRILGAAREFPSHLEELRFVAEVVFAVSGLGLEGLGAASSADASYDDPFVDVGGLLDVEQDGGQNRSVRAALRFGSLLQDGGISSPEMINLYVRRLYSLIEVA